MTVWRLESLEKKFKNDPEIKERYSKSIRDDIEKGYVRKLSEEEVSTNNKVTWYLPHRYVIDPKKPDRLRRVYDASANSGVKVLMIKCTQDQITCRRCLVICLDFEKEELHNQQTCEKYTTCCVYLQVISQLCGFFGENHRAKNRVSTSSRGPCSEKCWRHLVPTIQ